MTTPLSFTITPGAVNPAAGASQAYRTAAGIQDTPEAGALGGLGGDTTGFGAVLSRAVDGAIAAGRDADHKSIAAVEGHGSITDVVTAMSKAELALQTTATIRDRMVQAYQDIMRMPI